MKEIINENGAVYCNGKVWEKLQEKITVLNPSTIFILADENTARFCLPILLNETHFSKKPEILIVPAGEQYKTIATCLKLWEDLSEKGADRSSLLLNLGGGMITDMGGFIASTFRRGISFINIPTSLLAMVDASIGGKNGVDLGVLKNQIGLINPADSVIIDTQFLDSLPQNEITSGFAEMLKHGLIHSKKYWDTLLSFNVQNKQATEDAIWSSIEIKNNIVAIDPKEQHQRKALNFGHTLGHAIESFCLESEKKQTLLHGEAIAIGMILACYISSKLVNFPKEKCDDVCKTILKHFPKTSFSQSEINTIIELLKYDKKNKNGTVLFVLLIDLGNFKTDCVATNTLINEAFNYYQNS